jgi:DNA-binding beta-propeller fold protein YncE
MNHELAHPDGYENKGRQRRPVKIVLLAAAALVGGGVLAGTVLAGSPPAGRLAPEPLLQPGAGSKVVANAAHLLPASWQQPQSGWLYVLDPNQLDLESQLLLVDPRSGTVKGVIRAGNDPAMALSPDGHRLYLASKRGGADTLSVVDTASGHVLGSAAISFRWGDTILPTSSSMAVSADGARVYVRTHQTLASGIDKETVTSFDTATMRFTADAVDVTGCGASSLLVAPQIPMKLVCLQSGNVRSIGGDSAQVVSIPRVTDERRDKNGNRINLGRLAGGALSADGKTIYGISEGGRLSIVDAATQVGRHVDLGIGTDRWVVPNRVSLSADGTRLYIGAGRLADRDHSRADQMLVVDTATSTVIKTISASAVFWSFTLSRDGSHLYASQPETRSVALIDTVTGAQSRAITGLGESPALVMEAP